MSLRIWHISDTHGYHNFLNIPENIDIVIFSGDCSNWSDIARNSVEVEDFLFWMDSLPIKHKIFVAGNHDTSIESGFISREKIEKNGTKYLYNEEIIIEEYIPIFDGQFKLGDIRIWGSPFTPTFGNWAFMKNRGKLAPLWETMPKNLDILVTHGPGMGTLDWSLNQGGTFDRCGDRELWNEIVKKQPKYHLFGHIHNVKDNKGHMIRNQGIIKFPDISTTFINSSVVEDGKFGILTHHGYIFEI